MQRNGSWDDRLHLAKQLTFSSFSDDYYDVWSRDIKRTFEIVLLPGYSPPAGLDRNSKDALWFDGHVSSPLPVWDGFSSLALFEVIYECMDYHGRSPFIKVREVKSGAFVSDTRSQESLRLRPRRWSGMHPKEVHNHIFELRMWGSLFNSAHDTGNHEETGEIYRSITSKRQRDDIHRADDQRRGAYMGRDGIDSLAMAELERNPPDHDGKVMSEGPSGSGIASLTDPNAASIELHPMSWFSNSRNVGLLRVDHFKGMPVPASLLRYAMSLD